jgi:type II secretory pathway pseudopilin PulG
VAPCNHCPEHGNREAGYTMVLLIWALMLMSILMGVAVQTVTFQMQREREAELIFRGEQYVEAIRLYQQKYGRNPMQLKELWEAKPRVIRKKWKDPMTDSENWGLVFMGQAGHQIRPRTAGLDRDQTPTPTPTPTPSPGGREGAFGASDKPPQEIGPIIGVYSRSCDDSIRTYKGRTTYCEWKFTLEQKQQKGTKPGQPPPGGDR